MKKILLSCLAAVGMTLFSGAASAWHDGSKSSYCPTGSATCSTGGSYGGSSAYCPTGDCNTNYQQYCYNKCTPTRERVCKTEWREVTTCKPQRRVIYVEQCATDDCYNPCGGGYCANVKTPVEYTTCQKVVHKEPIEVCQWVDTCKKETKCIALPTCEGGSTVTSPPAMSGWKHKGEYWTPTH